MKFRKMTALLLVSVMLVGTAGCSAETDDVTDQAMNLIQSEEEHILKIKNAYNSNYAGKTYGEAFDDFFSQPAWKYFEGSHEMEDGTKKVSDIVEFTGYCTYKEVEVKALLQFTLNEEEGTFEPTYLAFNDVPQDTLILVGLLEAVFTHESSENDTQAAENTAQNENIDEKLPEVQEDAAVNAGDYAYLEAFIETINSYSDPPDCTGEELETYYKRQYDDWENGTGYEFISLGSDGELHLNLTWDYEGAWYDTYSGRCHMTISTDDYYKFYVEIDWGSSAWDNTHWSMSGFYDDEIGGIVYGNGCEVNQHWDDNDVMQEETVYTGGTGVISQKDGCIYWQDDVENIGVDSIFERE